MTYKVFGGTLSLTQSINQVLTVSSATASTSWYCQLLHCCVGRTVDCVSMIDCSRWTAYHCSVSPTLTRWRHCAMRCTTLVLSRAPSALLSLVPTLPRLLMLLSASPWQWMTRSARRRVYVRRRRALGVCHVAWCLRRQRPRFCRAANLWLVCWTFLLTFTIIYSCLHWCLQLVYFPCRVCNWKRSLIHLHHFASNHQFLHSRTGVVLRWGRGGGQLSTPPRTWSLPPQIFGYSSSMQ